MATTQRITKTPDFDTMAKRIYIPANMDSAADIKAGVEAIVKDFRLVWNARGAADRAVVKAEVSDLVGLKANRAHLNRALRMLDR